MELVKFLELDYKLLISWINSEELNYQWGGPKFKYPLTLEQINQHCSNNDVLPYLFKVNGEYVGYTELYREEDGKYRICRVFISENFRGQGLSRKMLSILVQKAENELHAKLMTLAVFEHNLIAIRSYESLGFVIISMEPNFTVMNGKCWNLIRMEKILC